MQGKVAGGDGGQHGRPQAVRGKLSRKGVGQVINRGRASLQRGQLVETLTGKNLAHPRQRGRSSREERAQVRLTGGRSWGLEDHRKVVVLAQAAVTKYTADWGTKTTDTLLTALEAGSMRSRHRQVWVHGEIALPGL